MRRPPLQALALGICLLAAPVTGAAEGEALLEMKNTILNLVDALVEQGIITKEKAEQIKQEAAMKAARDAAAQTPEATEAAEAEATAEAAAKEAAPAPVVRVPYVPEFVKEEIREQVRQELRKDVRDDVIAVAKEERWGVKDALPDWVNTMRIHGDIRLRLESETFPEGNPAFFQLVREGRLSDARAQFVVDPQLLNEQGVLLGGIDDLNIAENIPVSRNLTETRNRIPNRLRLNFTMTPAEHLELGVRLTTGNIRNPVSINQTLGNDGTRYDTQIDQMYVRWDWLTTDRGPVMTLNAGRFERPWVPQPTELLWDNDLQFEGAALTMTQGFGRRPDPVRPDNAVFMSAGVFPLGEVAFSTRDRWMFGMQGGARWNFSDRVRMRFGLGYYDYQNNVGRVNPVRPNLANPTCDPNIDGGRCFFEDPVYMYTVPIWMQRGNTLMNIRTDVTPGVLDRRPVALALASDFNIVNFTGQIDAALFEPYHVILDFDIAKNIGFDADEILRRTLLDPRVDALTPRSTGVAIFNNAFGDCRLADCIRERTLAYAVELTFGYPRIERRWQWQVLSQYRYVERDAVLDAFVESNFHQGSTDTRGLILAGLLGLSKHTILRARYMISDAIDDFTRTDPLTGARVTDGAPIGIDRFQLDFNTVF
jgi:polyhydroxyalkanoate synthesis regulator phasin